MSTATKKKIVISALVVAILGVFAYAIYQNMNATAEVDTSPHAAVNARADAIQNYVKANLTTLSPVTPVEGAEFTINRMRILDGNGTVNYTDGTIEYAADFTYTVSEDNTQVEVLSFTLQ